MLCLGGTACGRTQPAPAEPVEEAQIPVAARPAEVGRVREVLHASGIVVPAEGAEFLASAPEPARIIDITRKEGDAVTSGEILVRFELPSSAGGVARQRAELARARADLENARVTQTRTRDFADRGLISRRDVDVADRAFADAEAAVTRAASAEAGAEAAAARAIVRAPFAGVIVQRLHNPGDLVQGAATDPVLRLVDPKRLEVSAFVPADRYGHVLPGTSARIAGSAGSGAVRFNVAPRPSATTPGPGGTLAVRLSPLDALNLSPDTPIEVDIDLEEHASSVVVPPQAIVRSGASPVLFVAVGDRAQRREITTGVVGEEAVEIVSGVRAGELVITRGQTGLQDGARISVDTSAP